MAQPVMRVYFETTTGKLISQPLLYDVINQFEFKRADAAKFEIQFLENGVPFLLGGVPDIRFALKEEGKFDGESLVFTDDFTAPGDASGFYTAYPDFNTVDLNALLGHDGAGGDVSDDVAYIDAIAELTYSTDGLAWTSSPTIPARVFNDVIKGDEGVPVGGDPVYPTAQSLIDALEVTPAQAAGGDFTFTGSVSSDGDLTVGGTVVHFASGLMDPWPVNTVYKSPAEPLTDAEAAENVALLLNGSSSPVGGATFPGGFDASSEVSVTSAGAVVSVVALIAGVAGNLIETTDTLASGSWGAATLENGAAPVYLQSSDLVRSNFTEPSTARTLTAADKRAWIRCTNASDIVITVNTGIFAKGDEPVFEQAGAGQISFAGSATIEVSSQFLAKSSEQYAVIGLRFDSDSLAVCVGERELV